MAEWYYKCMTDVLGPLSASELKLEADAGRIIPDTPVRKGADGKWVMAQDVRGLLTPSHSAQADIPTAEEAGQTPFVRPTPIDSRRRNRTEDRSRSRSSSKYTALSCTVLVTILIGMGGVWWFAPKNRQSIVANAERSVAHIRGNIGQGTGFMVSSRLMVTNYHVIEMEPDSHLKIAFPAEDATAESITASVVYEDPAADIAILQLSEKRPYLKLARSSDFARGGEVTVIGNPGVGDELVLENAVSSGVLSTKTTIHGNEYYQLDISINPGNSGGPALDRSGRVLGVVTLKSTEEDGLGFCVPAERIEQALDSVDKLSDAEKQQSSALHNLRAVVNVIATMGDVYEMAMASYVDSMSKYVDLGLSSQAGLSAVQPTVDSLVRKFDAATVGKIEDVVAQLGSDTNIEPSLRKMFVDAWANYKELQSYVSNPRGSLLSYRAKYYELSDSRSKLIESLRLLSGAKKRE